MCVYNYKGLHTYSLTTIGIYLTRTVVMPAAAEVPWSKLWDVSCIFLLPLSEYKKSKKSVEYK